MDKFRSRSMICVLYPDDPTHVEAIYRLSTWSMCAILHDKDLDDNGELKKPHWHVVLKFSQGRWNTAVADDLGITPNYLKNCSSLESSLLYLTHYNAPDKYQYEDSLLFGDLKHKYFALVSDSVDEGAKVLQIVDMIDSVDGHVRYRDVLVTACQSGLWSQFRKLGSGVKFLIDEHNQLVGYRGSVANDLDS